MRNIQSNGYLIGLIVILLILFLVCLFVGAFAGTYPESHLPKQLFSLAWIIFIAIIIIATIAHILQQESNVAEQKLSLSINPEKFDSSNYPRVYQPSSKQALKSGVILPLAVVAFMTFPFWPANYGLAPIFINVLVVISGLVMAGFLVIRNYGYRITLMPDMIEIKTLIGTRSVRREEINSYSYQQYTKQGTSIMLRPKHSYSFINVLINFPLDKDFNEWFKSIPGSPQLPEITTKNS